MSETERKVGVTERLLAAITDIQHYIMHGDEEDKCPACPRWDELQNASVEIVNEVERLKALIVSLHDVFLWKDNRDAIEAILQEARDREQREAVAKGGETR